LRRARSVVLLVGGYDGSGNYGDVLQVATAIETVGGLPDGPLPVAIVEHETLAHHRAIAERFPSQLGQAAFVHFKNDDDTATSDLVQLRPGVLPSRAALYVYGGGFLNERWARRKVEHAAAGGQLRRRGSLPVVASGLQVDEPAVAPGGVAHELLARASFVGARDIQSLEYLRDHLPVPAAGRVELSGDDAVPFLRPGEARRESVVNLHLNEGIWVSEDPDARAERIVALLKMVSQASQTRLKLQPILAYEDPRVSERRAHAALFDRFGDELAEAGYYIDAPLDILEDAIGDELAGFRRARLTVACSYHVTLTSLLSAIPTVLLAENGYYEQKALGLRHLFDLDGGLIGVRGTVQDAADAAALLVDGEGSDRLEAHLRAHAEPVLARHEKGRHRVRDSLAASLRRRSLRGMMRFADAG
jgi:polysaccharide pyruvyl transferase WcaK-like protein